MICGSFAHLNHIRGYGFRCHRQKGTCARQEHEWATPEALVARLDKQALKSFMTPEDAAGGTLLTFGYLLR